MSVRLRSAVANIPALRAGYRIMDLLLHDLRHAVRQLRRSPGFAAVAVLTLAVGIGANTMVFSYANWVALRPIPAVQDPHRLFMFEFQRASSDVPANLPSYPDLRDFKANAPALAGIAAYNPGTLGVYLPGMSPRDVQAEYVTADFFQVLGVRLLEGFAFTPEQERSATTALTAVISERLGSELFRGAPALGRHVGLNGADALIVGVAPRAFRGPELTNDVDVWVPGTAVPLTLHMPIPVPPTLERRNSGTFNRFIARLAPGATPAQAAEQIQRTAQRILATYPEESKGYRDTNVRVRPGLVGRFRNRAQVDQLLTACAGLGGLLLFIALANVTNLYLFRLASRSDESALRRALGASETRLFRQRFAETLVVAMVAGALGLGMAAVLLRILSGRPANSLDAIIGQRIDAIQGIAFDARVFGFMVVLIATGALVLALVATFWERRANLIAELRRSAARGSAAMPRLRQGLSVLQLALSIAVLIGGILLTSTLRSLQQVPLGFESSVRAFWFSPRNAGYGPAEALGLYDRILPRVHAVAGVEEVAVANITPFTGVALSTKFIPDGGGPADTTRASTFLVSGNYFRTLGIPLVAGRTFSETEDRMAAPSLLSSAVISETVARRIFGNTNPIGRHLRPPGTTGLFSQANEYEVIGVVRDSKYGDLSRPDQDPTVYRPMREGGGTMIMLVRSAPGASNQGDITRILGEIAPTIPLTSAATLAEAISDRIGEQRLLAKVTSIGALLAVLLAAVGIYALVAFGVTERRREFGIRMALGARAGQVGKLVLRQGLWLGGSGVVLGLGAALGLSRLISSRLFGVSPLDPLIYAGAAVALGFVVLVACLVPARAATRVDPMVALRNE